VTLRIIAGRHRGRRIAAPVADGQEGGGQSETRPTADRVREALFNILQHAPFAGGSGTWSLAGARVLDGYAGSGALGLEALSRGAAHAVFMDHATAALAAIRRNAETLGEGDAVTILRADPGDPPQADAPCTLVMLDPPYGAGLASAALTTLAAHGWLAPDAVVVVEQAAGEDEDLATIAGLTAVDRRRYGKSQLVFLVAAPGRRA